MMKAKIIGIVIVWLLVSFMNFGALNADDRYRYHYTGRDKAAMEALFALFPVVGTLSAIFTTGFCEYGFSWKVGP
jgi:TRAP-type mannitol/chloroaromatic compound transport system permease small subunit